MSPVISWLVGTPPAIAAALVAATVSLLTTLTTLFVAPSIKYAFDKRLESRKLDMQYRFEQRKALKDHIARYKGPFLEAGDLLNDRFKNYERNLATDRPDQRRLEWLAMNGVYYGDLSYYKTSFAFRLLRLLGTIRLVQMEAVFIDTTVAGKEDGDFLKALRLNLSAWSDVRLFEGLGYDDEEPVDHFFRDDLGKIADRLSPNKNLLDFDEFVQAVRVQDHPYIDVFRFFDGLRASETRFRHDRVICAHLILATTLNAFGYDYQITHKNDIRKIAAKADNRVVLSNLSKSIRDIGLQRNTSFSHTLKLLGDLQRN